MKRFHYITAIACGPLFLVSCEDYDFGVTPEVLARVTYEENFRKEFGAFDPANDFNLALRGEVTVTPNGNREVCIYKKAPNGYQLIARYDDVTSTSTLGFDLPKGETEILVVNGSATQVTTIGGSVTFERGGGSSVTRVAKGYTASDDPLKNLFKGEDDKIKVELNDGSRYTYLYYDAEAAESFDDVDHLKENRFNKNFTIDDFSLVSTGEFIIYPTFWNAAIASRVGIYYYADNGEIKKYPLFGNHEYNENIQYLKNDEWITENTAYSCYGDTPFPYGGGHFSLTTLNAQKYRSKGIIVNLPVGTKFGFYTPMFEKLKSHAKVNVNVTDDLYYSRYTVNFNSNVYIPNNVGKSWDGVSALPGSNTSGEYEESVCYWFGPKEDGSGDIEKITWKNHNGRLDAYSESNLNPPDAWEKVYTIENYTDNTRHAVMFGMYYDEKGDMVIGAEDCYFQSSWDHTDYDLNDRVFKIYGSQPLVLNNKAQSWHLAFEDLGGSFDWDFNDVILQIDYVSGQSKARITPIAAGGTLHSKVFFNDTDNDSKKQPLGEIHEWLGATPLAAEQLYAPINASRRGAPGVQKVVEITDPTSFSISGAMEAANGSTNGTSSKGILSIYIETAGNDEGTTNTIAYQGMGKAPAMLVLPTSYQSEDKYLEWAWPTENFDIREAYKTEGHKFTEWVADHTKAQDWYKHPTKGTVEAKVAGKYANGATTAGSEYEKPTYGTTISFPGKNTDNQYVFDVNSTFGSATSATVTLALKGKLADNALYAHNGSTIKGNALGKWERMNNGGTYTTIGEGHNSGTTAVDVEGMYQITLSAADLAAIKDAGHWAITAGSTSEIIYIAFK